MKTAPSVSMPFPASMVRLPVNSQSMNSRRPMSVARKDEARSGSSESRNRQLMNRLPVPMPLSEAWPTEGEHERPHRQGAPEATHHVRTKATALH